MTDINHAHQVSTLGIFVLPLPMGPGACLEMMLVPW
jgi:hypothetical protein